jgi:invasion protein IalB
MGQNQPPNQWVMNCNYEKGKDCTVSAMIDGGINNLLGTFLIVSYSVAYTTLTVVADGLGQNASMQVDSWPWVTTSICTGGECSYEQGKSAELLNALLRGSQVTIQLSTSDDGMVGPLSNTLQGFAAQYQRAVQAQRGR